MELSAVGESVFAAESIIKRRIRRVFAVFTHRLCLNTYYATICLCSADRRSSDNLNVLRVCFAGSLGISREMEGLVSEVSIIAEAVKDSAPSWSLRTTAPPQTLVVTQLVDVFIISSAPCAMVQFAVCMGACVLQSGVVNVRVPARWDEVHTSFSNGWVHHAPLPAT